MQSSLSPIIPAFSQMRFHALRNPICRPMRWLQKMPGRQAFIILWLDTKWLLPLICHVRS
ncbi:MAG TPA: hypothetical protein DHV59_05935 [Oxalobacteraceae bacterium]|nr:hypothetical protein [Oxalobacteraceae bacterium]